MPVILIRVGRRAMARTFRCRVHALICITLVVFSLCSAPAFACLCSCAGDAMEGNDSKIVGTVATQFEQVFSGLTISTERIDEPVTGVTVTAGDVVEDPGYWVRSRILVLRVWRGTPATVAEVWTPVVTSCDSPPITGLHFVALAKLEEGRSVARNTFCDCDLRAAATTERGTFAAAGIAVVLAATALVVVLLFLLIKAIRRRRVSA